MNEVIIGIDLGTTFSAVSVVQGGEPVVISSSEGTRTVPSVVAFKNSGDRIVGILAKRQAVTNPLNTISSVKRFMGHSYKEVINETTSYKVKEGSNGLAVIEVPNVNKDFTPEELSAAILQKLKKDAEDYLGHPVTKAVITVPAYFNDSQRKSTKIAAEIAGLDAVRIINEPTAAALAYGFNKDKSGYILVFDLGGGTFDCSLLDVGEGTYEVIATSGDSHLGGDDFDNVIVGYIIKESAKFTTVDLKKDPAAFQRIKESAEKAKIELSSQLSTSINIPYVTVENNQPIHLDINLTRATFEELSKKLLDRIKKPLEDVFTNGVDKTKINDVILVGGSSRIPCVQTLIADFVGIIPSKSVNPDEAVAIGAAIQGSILSGNTTGIVLLDVTPLPLAVEVSGGLVDVLIPKNTTIPVQKSQIYTTAVPNQPSVTVHVVQGLRSLAKDNKSLGQFHLDGIVPAPQGVPQIEVTFDLNTNGILSVTAKDKGTGKSQHITISGSSNLSSEEIERMTQEAEQYRQADEEARQLVNLKNELESICNSTEKLISDNSNLDDSDKTKITDAIAKARESLAGTKDEIESAKSALVNIIHPITEKLYQQAPVETEPVDAEIV